MTVRFARSWGSSDEARVLGTCAWGVTDFGESGSGAGAFAEGRGGPDETRGRGGNASELAEDTAGGGLVIGAGGGGRVDTGIAGGIEGAALAGIRAVGGGGSGARGAGFGAGVAIGASAAE